MTCLKNVAPPPVTGTLPRSPRLLVSVRNVTEARAAMAGSADVIDVKEPTAGALGRATSSDMQDIAGVVATSPASPCSVALGELLELQSASDPVVIPDTVRWVKVGLSQCADQPQWRQIWADVRRRLNRNVDWIAVAYADAEAARAPSLHAVLDAAVSSGCAGLLVDTFTKSVGSLLDYYALDQLHDLITSAQQAGLMVALAGRVQMPDLPAIVGLRPDLIAVRSAVCRNSDRLAAVDADAVRAFRQAMHHASVPAGQKPV